MTSLILKDGIQTEEGRVCERVEKVEFADDGMWGIAEVCAMEIRYKALFNVSCDRLGQKGHSD